VANQLGRLGVLTALNMVIGLAAGSVYTMAPRKGDF
jgi:hypothetical protein